MARAAVQGHREKLGLMASTGSPADLERLLTALGPGLGVFVGREKTATLLLEIRAELDLPGLPR